MRKISLHIGLPHAGSTSIQTCLKRNRAALREAGVLYPQSLGRRGHGSLVSYALESGTIDFRRRRMGIADRAAVDAFRTELEAALAADLQASGADRVILSAEQLSWELHSPAEVDRLAGLLRRHGEVDRVAVYLRPQADIWMSHRVNGVKRGRGRAAALLGALTSLGSLDYRRMLDLWAGAFGEAALRVRILDPAEFAGADLYDDFAAATALPGEALAVRPAPRNERLAAEAVAELQRINADRNRAHRQMSADDKAMVKEMKRGTGQRLEVPAWQRALIEGLFARGNRAVARRHFGRDRLFLARSAADIPADDDTEIEAATVQRLK